MWACRLLHAHTILHKSTAHERPYLFKHLLVAASWVSRLSNSLRDSDTLGAYVIHRHTCTDASPTVAKPVRKRDRRKKSCRHATGHPPSYTGATCTLQFLHAVQMHTILRRLLASGPPSSCIVIAAAAASPLLPLRQPQHPCPRRHPPAPAQANPVPCSPAALNPSA